MQAQRTAWSAFDGLDENEWHADILFQGHQCIATYSSSSDCLTIKRDLKDGTARMLLHIPSTVVLNLETEEEMEERQRMRRVSDSAVKVLYSKSKYRGAAALQGVPPTERFPYVYVHSRTGTAVGSSSVSPPPAPLARSTPAIGRKRRVSRSGSHEDPMADSLAYDETYKAIFFLHYIRMEPSGKLRSIHTLHLTATSEKAHRDLQVLTAHLLERVYEKSAKNILIFVSPVSGKGDALNVVDETLLPVLHFSKHQIEVIVTTRAHHCEDYLADVRNGVNEHYVVVGVGGDGMVHEIVNGLHRRKLAFIRHLREEEAAAAARGSPLLPGTGALVQGRGGSVPAPVSELTDEQSEGEEEPCLRGDYPTLTDILQGWDHLLPLIATVPSGSACGLAKGLDELHPLAASLALIRCRTVHADLLYFRFQPCPELLKHHESKCSVRNLRNLNTKFKAYREKYKAELARRKPEDAPLHPFLESGENVYEDPISMDLGAPTLSERVAFMSISYGVPNDIDRGSERFRFMGNARFTVYGGLIIVRGPSKYNFKVRYLPWKGDDGNLVEKLHAMDSVPTHVPVCTNREDCTYCRRYSEVEPGSPRSPRSATVSSATLRRSTASRRRSTASNVTPTVFTDAALMGESAVDFDDTSLPWKEVELEMHMLMVCTMKDVARDAVMAPLAHFGDGAMDIIYCRAGKEYGRKHLIQMMGAMEAGSHLGQDFVSYAKATAVEITTDGGLVMADGEMMPLGKVRITRLRRSINFVRCDY